MSSNTENTEAKLAAYIDGQLDPAERAQIEQFLQANPDHRKLLADMIAQRDVLRSLPRDKAPSDIYDAIQAQLERSVLLDDSAHAAAPTIRHGRRTSLLSIAAIVLLAVGLGGVLYFALPSTRQRSIETVASNQPTTVATSDMAAERAPAGGGAFARRKTTSPAPAIAEAPTPSLTPNVASNFRAASPTQQALSIAATQSAPDAGQLVLLVSTDDPSKVNRQVETYLASNKIRWEAVNGPADQVFYSRAASGGAVATQQPQQQVAPPAGAAATDNKSSAADSEATRELAAAEPAKKAEVDKIAQAAVEGAAAPAEKLADTSSPTAGQEAKDRLGAGTQLQQSIQALPQKQLGRQYFYNAATAQNQKNATGQQYIIARGMTRQQAVQLTDTLSADRPTQRARLIGQLPASAQVNRQDTPPTLSQPQATTAETKTGVPEDIGGFAVTQQQTQQSQQPVQQQQQAQVADGQLAVPQAAPTAPADQAQSATTAPTTQSEPGVDVVILVEDESPAATTAPTTTTAPATAPTTQSAPAY